MRAVLAAVLVVLVVALPGVARADSDLDLDRVPDHCVSIGEGYSLSAKLDKGIRLTMRQLETQWDVRGKTDVGRSTHAKVVRVYPACLEGGVVEGFWRVAFYRPTMRTLGAAYMSLVFSVRAS